MASDYDPASVHMALGVLMEQQQCDFRRAISLLTASATAAGRTLTDVAVEVIDDPRRVVVGGQGAGPCSM